MKVILHIGAPKTGTSALQYFLNSNRQALFQFGFYYPKHGLDRNNVSGGHAALGSALLKGDLDTAEKQVITWLDEAKSRSASLLLSGESFYTKQNELRKLFDGCDVRVISYFRDPLETLVSNHNQLVKRHNAVMSLDQFLLAHSSRSVKSVTGEILEDWAALFGTDNVTVLPYHRASFPNKSIELSFLQALDIPQSSWHFFNRSAAPINPSYTYGAFELKRLLNNLLPSFPTRVAFEVDWTLQRFSDQWIASGTANRRQAVSKRLLVILNATFQETNRKVKNEYLEYVPHGFLEPFSESEHVESEAERPLGEVISAYSYLAAEMPAFVVELKAHLASLVRNGQHSYGVYKLCEIIGIPFDEPATKLVVSENSLNILLSEKAKAPDLLREVANILRQNRQEGLALDVIQRARELRPHGVGIQKIEQEIKKKLELLEKS